MFCVLSQLISFLPRISAAARHTSPDLAIFSAEDTIRVSASTTKLRPRYHEQQTTTSQHHNPPLYFPSHLVGTVMAILLDPYQGLFQSESCHKAQTRLSIPSMWRTPTVRIETSFQLLWLPLYCIQMHHILLHCFIVFPSLATRWSFQSWFMGIKWTFLPPFPIAQECSVFDELSENNGPKFAAQVPDQFKLIQLERELWQ